MADSTFEGYVALPKGGHGPGVLVLHAWWGLTGYVQGVCDRLAEQGFVAAAPDLYHGVATVTIAEAEELSSELDGAAAKAQVGAALDWLLAGPAAQGERAAVLGFSLGAFFALWLASERPEQLAAAVVFYGTGPMRFEKAGPAFLGHFAEHDPYEPLDGVRDLEEQLRSAGAEVSFYVYPGTGHWFVEYDRPDAYNPEAAETAWQRTDEFLKRRLSQE